MLTVHCPRHGTEVLLGWRAVRAVVNTDDGIHVHWTCRCGAEGVLRTGRPRPAGSRTAVAA
jgi:hypothetical protein